MIVITNKQIAECNDIHLADNILYCSVTACKDCSFVMGEFDSKELAEATFNKIADAVKDHGNETIVDFRR